MEIAYCGAVFREAGLTSALRAVGTGNSRFPASNPPVAYNRQRHHRDQDGDKQYHQHWAFPRVDGRDKSIRKQNSLQWTLSDLGIVALYKFN